MLGSRRTCALLLLFAGSVFPVAAGAQEPAAVVAALERHLVDLTERAEPSIVSIVRGRAGGPASDPLAPFGPLPGRGPLPRNQFGRPAEADFSPEKFGAGVVIADAAGQRFILTNQHLVAGGPVAGMDDAGAARIYVRFHDRRGYFATVHAADPRSDLAVLRVDYPQLGIDPPVPREAFPKPLRLSAAQEYRKGQFVLIFGNPYAIARDGSASVGWGIIGNVLRRPAPAEPSGGNREPDETIHHYGTLLQLDARLTLGFSGGAAINRDGELIGLTTPLAALEGYETTAGFAIPIDAGTRRIIDALMAGHEAEYGLLGVEPGDITADQMLIFGPELAGRGGAAQVVGVKRDSPAGKAGVRSGDLILAIDGRPVRGTADLMREVGLAGPGTTVQMELGRAQAGETRFARVTLGKWPVINDSDIVATVPRQQPWRGIRVDYATGRQRFLPQRLDPYPRGVVVLSAEGPLGGENGLKPGDFIVAVDGRSVDSPAEFDNAVRQSNRVVLDLADGRSVVAP